MLFSFHCPSCKGKLEADASLSGTQANCPQCGKPVAIPAARVAAGTTLAGFRLERRLGKGGMGEVYLATQLSVQRLVAVKILPPDFAENPEAVRRFMHEGRLAARLDHHNIVTVHEAGEDSGTYYLAMAYIEGESLDQRLKRDRILPEAESLAIVRAVADALAYAWESFQLLHRDLKPANIMVDRRGRVFLMDLGLAKSLGDESGMTLSGAVLGTPQYMSPEQAMGTPRLTVGTDVYSLGATLYHLVTGAPPFTGGTTLQVLHQHMYDPLPSPRLRNPGLSEGCSQLIQAMMAKQPAARYGDWRALLADIDRVLQGGQPTSYPEAAPPRAAGPDGAQASLSRAADGAARPNPAAVSAGPPAAAKAQLARQAREALARQQQPTPKPAAAGGVVWRANWLNLSLVAAVVVVLLLGLGVLIARGRGHTAGAGSGETDRADRMERTDRTRQTDTRPVAGPATPLAPATPAESAPPAGNAAATPAPPTAGPTGPVAPPAELGPPVTPESRIRYDLEVARKAVLGAGLQAQALAALTQEIAAIEKGIGELPRLDPEVVRSILPLNDLHTHVYALYGALRTAQRVAPLTVWGANPWDFLSPTDLPAAPPAAALRITAMRGETRAGAINVTNSTAEPMRAALSFAGLPGGQPPADVTVHEVLWTDTTEGTPVAAALPAVAAVAGAYEIAIPAGMTRQVCFSFRPVQTPAGVHRGELRLKVKGLAPVTVPVALRVFDLDFPAQPTLHLGGWDYAAPHATCYGITPENRAALIAHWRERYVDSPWAWPDIMPIGSFGPDGHFAQTPDTTAFDAWIAGWPEARRYFVFNNVGDDIGGVRIGDPGFAPRVEAWIHFWVKHLRTKGVQPEQLFLLLVDGLKQASQAKTTVAWARVIQTAEPGVVIWAVPMYEDPAKAPSELLAICDVLCPDRPMLLEGGKPFADFYRGQRAAGRRLAFTASRGPAFLLDPYSYYRLQAWTCFEFGAEGTSFWSLTDTGGRDSWHAYAAGRIAYTPTFIGPDSVTAGKHMEAIRESVEDFEYLVQLRQRIAAVGEATPNQALLPAARALLAEAPARVLGAPGASALQWRDPKDRSLADTVRIEIGEMLEKMK
jgi:hypothetical protein